MLKKAERILNELQQYKRPKEEILRTAIQDKLNTSVKLYYEELSSSITRLAYRKADYVLKEINKEEFYEKDRYVR